MKLKYIGENKFSLRTGRTYEAKKNNDDTGDYYSIFDEGDDWYCYGIKFVENNFVDVTSEFENNAKSA